MTKRKEPTKTLFEVTIEKTVTMRAYGLVAVTARLDSTKKKFLKHCAEDVEDHVGQDAFFEIGDNMDTRVVDIQDADSVRASRLKSERCPHCKEILNKWVLDYGEVDD